MNNTTDDQILEAMKRLANLLREAKREAGEAVVSAARKTELEAWIERHEAEIDARIIVSNGTPSASRSAPPAGRTVRPRPAPGRASGR